MDHQEHNNNEFRNVRKEVGEKTKKQKKRIQAY